MGLSGGRPVNYRFGEYEADPQAGELRKRGVRLPLRQKSFEALTALLEHPGAVVTRAELRRRLWPEGVFLDFENGLNSAMNRLRSSLNDSASRPRFIETLPRLGYRFVAPLEVLRDTVPTLAVLPFENLNHDPEHDFFADGVADALTTALGSVRTLRVISRQSVLHLKGSRRTLPEIAQELAADAVVEGSVLLAGNRARITAQLVQASPERHLWAKSYECELGDILRIQGQVSSAIAQAVRAALTPVERQWLERSRPVDAEAHLAYLKGLHHMSQWSGRSFEKAIECFRCAVETDPGHALAYAHMADCYGMLGNWGHRPVVETFQRAKQAASRALALDDSLSTAHWAYAWAIWICDWDLARCEAEMRRAIELNPSDAHAHVAYSTFLVTTTAERARAVSEMKAGLELDPLSPYMNALLAWTYLFVREYERASEQALKTLDLYPDSLLAWWGLGLARMCASRHDEAVSALEKAAAISPEPLSLAYLGSALARAGRLDAARTILAQLAARCEREPVPPRCFVFLHAALGDYGQALDWLEKSYEQRDSGIFWLRVTPLYDPLRSAPRFKRVLRRVGL